MKILCDQQQKIESAIDLLKKSIDHLPLESTPVWLRVYKYKVKPVNQEKQPKFKNLAYHCKYYVVCESEGSAWCIRNAKSVIDRRTWRKLAVLNHDGELGWTYCNTIYHQHRMKCMVQSDPDPEDRKKVKSITPSNEIRC